MKMRNNQGQEVYYNQVIKHGVERYIIQAATKETIILGRDRQKRKSRTFAQEAQAEAWLRRMGFRVI